MRFKTSEDVDAPVSLVWARIIDFSGVEADIRARGATLSRVGQWTQIHSGAEWRGQVQIRGRLRPVSSRIATLIPEDSCDIHTQIGGLEAVYELRLIALREDFTRIQAMLNLSASSLSARLSLQTLKLARGRVLTRMQTMLARQGAKAEADHQALRQN
ncbi:hypothetical protein V8J82_05730 [Gymnodinialimonas sp. 2305UL16-5]|uniref:hypothetical protein n=1 Tax=Gymnodinialimonas mytili TaxID=3126503 RepID=UPI0030A6C811